MALNWRTIDLLDSNDLSKSAELSNDMRQLNESIIKHYESICESKSVMCFGDDTLYIWNCEDQCVYRCQLKDSSHITNIQTLALTNPPKFDVDYLQFSATNRYLALYGSRGVNVLELPKKWATHHTHENGQRYLLNRSWGIAERFFVCNQKIRLLCFGWHRACHEQKHIVLLTNDNCLRILDITDEQTPIQVINLSAADSNASISESCVSIYALSLGESSVSFDFGPPIAKGFSVDPSSVTSRDECLWPLYVLKGNGDVILVYTSLKYSYVSKCILGPLTMMPPAEDNYGVDACSILCLDTVPPVIVIATSSGIIHHCIALDSEDDSKCHSHQSLLPQPILYVYESIELALSLTSSIEYHDITCTLTLHRDPITVMRYYCSHSYGIHAIAIPFISQLNAKDDFAFNEEESIVEHLICTKPIQTDDSRTGTTPLGLVIAYQQGNSHLIVLLNSGELISQKLSTNYTYNLIDFEQNNDIPKTLSAPKCVDFVEHIQHILKRNVSAPILKSKNSEETNQLNQKNLQLLLTTTDILRKEYLNKLKLAAVAIERRFKGLKMDKQIQLKEIERCSHEKEYLIKGMEEFAEKYDNALAQHEILSNRIDLVLETLQNRQPTLSEAEIALRDELKKINNKLTSHRNKFEQIRLKSKYQEQHLHTNPAEHYPSSPMKVRSRQLYDGSTVRSPSTNQLKSIREMLSNEGESISELLQKVNHVKINE